MAESVRRHKRGAQVVDVGRQITLLTGACIPTVSMLPCMALMTILAREGEAMSYTPKYLGHVNIYVRNVELSHQWYADILGLHTYDYMPGRAAFLSADQEQSHEVALIQVGDEAPLQQKGQVGLNHMAWMMHSLDDLKEVYQRLKDRNVSIDHVSDHGISVGVYFRDPDGNGIEVSYELPRNEWPRTDKVFSGEGRLKGRFPGPWDEHLAPQLTATR